MLMNRAVLRIPDQRSEDSMIERAAELLTGAVLGFRDGLMGAACVGNRSIRAIRAAPT
jgi:hypothetical protein